MSAIIMTLLTHFNMPQYTELVLGVHGALAAAFLGDKFGKNTDRLEQMMETVNGRLALGDVQTLGSHLAETISEQLKQVAPGGIPPQDLLRILTDVHQKLADSVPSQALSQLSSMTGGQGMHGEGLQPIVTAGGSLFDVNVTATPDAGGLAEMIGQPFYHEQGHEQGQEQGEVLVP